MGIAVSDDRRRRLRQAQRLTRFAKTSAFRALLFAVLFLTPDLSFFGYLAGPRVGAWAYNLAHGLIGPLLLAATGGLTGDGLSIALALIWLAHIGFDRALGYGLKSPDGFGVTHLGLIGAARRDRRAAA